MTILFIESRLIVYLSNYANLLNGMSIENLKSEFFKKYSTDGFHFYPGNKNEDFMIEYYESNNGIPSSGDTDYFMHCLRSNLVDKYFLYHILNVISVLPDTLLPEIVETMKGLTSSYKILNTVIKNLKRIYTFQKLESYLQDEFQKPNLNIEKYYLASMMCENTIEEHYDWKNNHLTVILKAVYKWDGELFRKSFIELNKEERISYSKTMNTIMNKRYKMVMDQYLDDNTPYFLLMMLKLIFPIDIESCNESLIELRIKVYEKSRVIFPEDFEGN